MAVPERPRRRGIWIAIATVTAFVIVVPLGVQIWGRLIRQTRDPSICTARDRGRLWTQPTR
jgi:hypothetical protein